MSAALAVNDAAFEQEVLKSDLPVLVDFWAEWCGPCRMVAPILDEVAKEYHGKLKVVKVNVDENQKTAMDYRIRSIPTLAFIKNGQLVKQIVGAQPKDRLIQEIEEVLKG